MSKSSMVKQLFNFTENASESMIGRMMDNSNYGVRAGLAGAAIGGTVSYATGGEFLPGAAGGALGGIAMGKVHGHLKANSKFAHGGLTKMAEGEGIGGWGARKILGGDDIMDSAGALTGETTQGFIGGINTMQRRHAMMAGAGLAGFAAGGNRNSKRRGFNAHRGNTF